MNREKVLENLIKSSFSLKINMNDTFHYACADVSELNAEDALDLLPFIHDYGFEALLAYEAIKRGYDPEIKDYITNSFLEIKKTLIQKMKENENFLSELNFTKRNEENEIKEFGGVLSFKFVPPSWFQKTFKRQRHYNCICSCQGRKEIGIGSNMKEAKENLKIKIGGKNEG